MQRFWCHIVNNSKTHEEPGSGLCTEKKINLLNLRNPSILRTFLPNPGPFQPAARVAPPPPPLRDSHSVLSLGVNCTSSPSGAVTVSAGSNYLPSLSTRVHITAGASLTGLCGDEKIHDPGTFAQRVTLTGLTSAEALQTHPRRCPVSAAPSTTVLPSPFL